MRYLLYILTLIFIATQSYSQDENTQKIDSLKSVIDQTENDTIKINALKEWDNLIWSTTALSAKIG